MRQDAACAWKARCYAVFFSTVPRSIRVAEVKSAAKQVIRGFDAFTAAEGCELVW